MSLEEDLGVPPGHVRIALAVRRRITKVTPAVDHLLGRAAADAELEPSGRDEVGGARVFRHIARVFVPHVDDRRANLDRARPRADGRQQRERRAELAGEVMHANERAVRAQLLRGDSQFDRLEQTRRTRDRTSEPYESVQCPKERNPIFFNGHPELRQARPPSMCRGPRNRRSARR